MEAHIRTFWENWVMLGVLNNVSCKELPGYFLTDSTTSPGSLYHNLCSSPSQRIMLHGKCRATENLKLPDSLFCSTLRVKDSLRKYLSHSKQVAEPGLSPGLPNPLDLILKLFNTQPSPPMPNEREWWSLMLTPKGNQLQNNHLALLLWVGNLYP